MRLARPYPPCVPLELTNRDMVALLFLAAFVVAVLARPGGRAGLRSIAEAFRPFLPVVALFAAYFAGLVGIAERAGLWDPSLLKETLAWFIVSGILLLFRFTETYRKPGFVGRTFWSLVKGSALVEFFIGLTSFSFGVELLLLPAIIVLSVFAAFARTKAEYTPVKKLAEGLLGFLGLVLIVATLGSLIGQWEALDKSRLALSFALPFWATGGSLPFVFFFGLYANYQQVFSPIDRTAAHDRRARWRAKAAVLRTFHLRNRALGTFPPYAAMELAQTKSWGEARRFIAYQQAEVRLREAKEQLAAAKLRRFAGVQGTDWEGNPLDQREFGPTREALRRLASFHEAQYQDGRYRADLMTIVGDLLSKELPPDHGIVMAVRDNGRSWFAWHRTITGWCLGIGAAGPPPDRWVYEAPEPPKGFPRPGTNWKRGDFDEEPR